MTVPGGATSDYGAASRGIFCLRGGRDEHVSLRYSY